MIMGLTQDKNLEMKQIERQMGCMAGFLQLFDHYPFITSKRIHATKRISAASSSSSSPSSFDGFNGVPEPEKAVASPAVDKEVGRSQTAMMAATQSPDTPVKTSPAKSPLPLPIFDLKDGSSGTSPWKFCKDAPRLSLDSRATVDSRGSLHPREIRTNAVMGRCQNVGDGASTADCDDKQRSSPSVIARLMGLEPIRAQTIPQPEKKAELRRSASESRVSRDLFQSRIVDSSNFQLKQPNPNPSCSYYPNDEKSFAYAEKMTAATVVPAEYSLRSSNKSEQQKFSNRSSPKASLHRKSFFDTADVFPEPKQSVSMEEEIGRRLRMRGIIEPSKDVETLKQILEAMQLKGLLHTDKSSDQIGYRNFVHDQPRFPFPFDESSIVLMKPATSSSVVSPIRQRTRNDFSPSPSFGGRMGVASSRESQYSVSPCRERSGADRSARSPNRARGSGSPTRPESSPRRGNSLVKPKPLSVETQRTRTESPMENRRASRKHSPRRVSTDQMGSPRPPRNRALTANLPQKEKITTIISFNEDESSSVSESTQSSSSQTESERVKTEEYKEGRTLLERCDKLLHSIADMTGSGNDSQPSPVSVLDSSFYKDESLTPSPVMKRSIDFKDHSGELEEDFWGASISPLPMKSKASSDNCDFDYISDILRASHYLPEDSDIFLLLEKQQYLKGKDTSKVHRLQRRLIFDTITEILDRHRELSPWKAFSWPSSPSGSPSLEKIWSEFQHIQEREKGDDLFETICGVLKKDLAGYGYNTWGDCPVEMAEAVLDMERLIFKDLISETIKDLAAIANTTLVSAAPRRKLVF